MSALDQAPPRTTQLYRMFDQHENLLYVGISVNALVRMLQHRGEKPWFESVRWISIQRFHNEDAGRLAEARAITQERPQYNTQFNYYRDTGDFDVPWRRTPEEHFQELQRLAATDASSITVLCEVMCAYADYVAAQGRHACRRPFWHDAPVPAGMVERGATWIQVLRSLGGLERWGRFDDDLPPEDRAWLRFDAPAAIRQFALDNMPPCAQACCGDH